MYKRQTYDEFVKFGRAAFSAKPGDVWNIQDIRDAWDVLPIVHHRHSHDDGWEKGQVTELNPLELQASIIRLVKQRVEDQAQNTQWVKQPATQKLPGSRFGLFLKEGIDKELKAESAKIYNKIIADVQDDLSTNSGTKAEEKERLARIIQYMICLLYTSPSPRD